MEAITNALDVGFVPNDITFDNSGILNNVISSLLNVSNLYFPSGAYYFNTPPNPISRPFVIRGNGINSTAFIRNYNPIDSFSALFEAQNTVIFENFSIMAQIGTSNGSAITLYGLSASSSILRDLYITGGYSATFAMPLILYSTDPLGIRGCTIDNVELFSATVHLAWFVNVKGLICNLSGYPAGGTCNNITIQNYGNSYSSNILFDTTYLEVLYLYSVSNMSFRGVSNTIVNEINCTNVTLL